MEGFYGTVYLQADEKGRYRIPSKYRAKLGEGSIFYMQNGSPYLSVISGAKSKEIIDKLSPMITLIDTPTSNAARAILSNLCEIKEDGQGRFTLPTELRQELELGKEVVFIGMGSKVEMWSKAKWEESCQKAKESLAYDEVITKLGEAITF
ncbi:MAG: division/cell wall cluster transcriptional repressor MraZ [Christensenellales bacterium]